MNIAPEEFARAVRDWMIPNLPAAVEAQVARFADVDLAEGITVPLAAPTSDMYELGGAQVALRYPMIEVSCPDFVVSGYDLAQDDGDLQVTIVVRIWDQHPRYDVLYRKMNRMIAAVLSALSQPGAFADARIDTVRGALRFNPETDQQDNIVSGALLAFTLQSTLARA